MSARVCAFACVCLFAGLAVLFVCVRVLACLRLRRWAQSVGSPRRSTPISTATSACASASPVRALASPSHARMHAATRALRELKGQRIGTAVAALRGRIYLYRTRRSEALFVQEAALFIGRRSIYRTRLCLSRARTARGSTYRVPDDQAVHGVEDLLADRVHRVPRSHLRPVPVPHSHLRPVPVRRSHLRSSRA